MKHNLYHYFVEGECEEKLINELKSINNRSLVAGKVDVLNVINEEIADARLLALNRNTNIIFIYDIDVEKTEILEKNIRKLKYYKFNNVFHIQSIKNLEDEIVFSSSLKTINNMFNTSSTSEFKRAFIKQKNISTKLNDIHFDSDKIWSRVNNIYPFARYSKEKDLEIIKSKIRGNSVLQKC